MRKSEELKPNSKGCFAKASEDEMLFVLRAQDLTSPVVILEWLKINWHTLTEEKIREAFECAMEMRNHEGKKSPD